jgi:hypothetical protein
MLLLLECAGLIAGRFGDGRKAADDPGETLERRCAAVFPESARLFRGARRGAFARPSFLG